MHALLRAIMKARFALKSEMEIQKRVDQVTQGVVEEWQWRKIIDKMYD